jgi:hypothetical protein
MRRRTRWIIFVVLATIVGVVSWIGYGVYRSVDSFMDGYALWDTGDLLVEYMKTHNDRWPASWSDLRPSFDKLVDKDGNDGHLRHGSRLEDLSRRVSIDWTADPLDVIRKGRDRRAVRAFSGNPPIWDSADPSNMVADYLKSRAATQPTSLPNK